VSEKLLASVTSPGTDIKLVDNVFVKLHHFDNVGDTHQGHSHTFDHITLLASGKMLMQHDNGEQEFSAPQLIVTPKGVTHKFTALESGTVFCCIHAIRDGDGVDDVAAPNLPPEKQWELLSKYKLTQ
jgi:quercetin dioxygenase-like cupin family protein